MSQQFNVLSDKAELALAAYATLVTGPTDDQRGALQDAAGSSMSPTQALGFAARYPTVVTTTSDPSSGLQATVFRDTAGNLTVAFRGTQIPEDLATGINIVLSGAAYQQIVAMYNWWLQATAVSSEPVSQYRIVGYAPTSPPAPGSLFLYQSAGVLFFLESAPPVLATGELVAALAGDPDAKVDVTGHSLGGHLSMAFSGLFAARTAGVTVFNAPGFVDSATNRDFFSRLGGAIPAAASIINVAADEALVDSSPFDWVAGMHSRPGTPVNIAIEKQTNSDEPNPFLPALNHSIVVLADSLAVFSLLSTLAPSLTTSDYKLILNQSANGTSASYERIVDALEALFGVNSTDLPTGNTNRNDLYNAIYGLKSNPVFIALTGQLQVSALGSFAAADLAGIALGSTALGYRYALRELNSFAVIGDNALYAPHNQGGELDLYDAVNRSGTLTTEWIADRAKLLHAELIRNAQDIADPQVPVRLPGSGDRVTEFHHYRAGKEEVFFAQPSDSSPGQLPTQVVSFTDDAGRLLVGSDHLLGDRLYGGAGTDYLIGRANNDSMEGGKGLDIYQYNASNSANDGDDTIRDIDGKGVIRFAQIQSGIFSSTVQSTVIADASVRVSGLHWNSADGRFSYIRSGDDLVVRVNGGSGGSMLLKDFRDGDFNIHLWDMRVEPQTAPPDIFGDLQPQDFDLSTDGIQTQTDALGNIIVTTTPEPNRTDLLYDSTANDRIIAGGGNDILRGVRGGDDWMSGDAGRDDLAGGAGGDLIEGGADGIYNDEAGGDIAYGDVGADEIYAGSKIGLGVAINEGNLGMPSNAKGEHLSGGGGDDWVVGAAGNDYLDGGSGRDLIVAGAGDDNITGDYGIAAFTPLWDIRRETTVQANMIVHSFNFVSGSVSADLGPGADDVIYAGGGADWVAAGDGDDFVDGGPGENKMWGEGGSDVLIGGADNDLLVGDNPTIITGAAEGSDYLDGGAGNDKLEGDGGNDVLIGGTGTDTLSGGRGRDIYVFNKGDGTETVFDTDTSLNNPDASVLVLGDGVSQSAIKFTTGSLAVDLGPSDPADPSSPHDVIHFNGFDQLDPTATTPLGEIRFAGGGSMSYADILTRGFDIDGTEGDDNNAPDQPPRNLVGTGVNDRIRGFGGNDLLFGLRGDDVLDGGDGVDQLLGGSGADTLYGGAEHDEIWGDAENGGIFAPPGGDAIYAGAGDDIVQGDGGGDQIFGDEGSDTLYGDDAADMLDGGAGNDFLYAQGYFFLDGFPYLNLFDDGASDTLHGGEGNDYLNAAAGADVLDGGTGDDDLEGEAGADDLTGGDGNDRLWGDKTGSPLAEQGNDTLDGGAGNDQLVGHAGNDTYVFGRGYGQDVVFDVDATAGNTDQVSFAADITPDHISAVQSGGSLVLQISGTTDTLTLANHFASTADRIEQIRFADGTLWTPGSTPLSIRGTAGNDALNGTSGPDVFEGLTGNDTMSGAAGNDTYRISRGDGLDVITDLDSTLGNVDRVLYAADISPADIQAARSGNNLVLRLSGATDQVSITNYFVNDGVTPNSVEQIKFLADSTLWDVATVKNKVLTGTAGNDFIQGYATGDALSGLAGNDTLSGNAGNDTLDGGSANDSLQGGTGNDTYLFARAHGQDTITDADATVGNTDAIAYAADILSSEVIVTRSNANLVLKLVGTSDQVTVTNYFQNDGANTSLVEQIRFQADATLWDVNAVKLLALTGTDSGDTIIGYASDDVLSGRAGNDTLTGNAGHDTLDGGAGNDSMQGGTGNDTYLVARGHGQDTISDADATAGNIDRIVYATDISPSEVRATRSGDNLVLKLTDTTDQVTVTGYFQNDGASTSLVERIEFTDGTNWDPALVKAMVLAPTEGDDAITGYATDDNLSGLGGNDTLRGAAGNDTLAGGAGNDLLSGEAGSDVYLFARGDGQDVIDNAAGEGSGTIDRLLFADDILPFDIIATREVRDLVLSIQGSGDQVRIRNYFFSGTNVVDEIRFADGTVWDEPSILAVLPTPPVIGTEANDFLFGTVSSELIRGLGGDDLIRGLGGDDTFEGGPGEDTIIAGAGNDTYLFNIGDGGPPDFFILGDDVTDAGGYDVLQLGPGIGTSGFDLFDHSDARGRMLVLNPAGTNAGVYIIGYFGTGHIEEIRFEDGTVWTDQTIAPLFPISGTSGNDNMIGTVIAEVMHGFDGNDTITGNAGHDTLDGGMGSDRLLGVVGNDSLIGGDGTDELLGGDGNDTLAGGLGGDTLYGEAGNDLLTAGTGEAKSAKVSNFLYGGSGDDVLVASGKTDQLYGDAGNDILLGDAGSDRLEDGEGSNLAFGAGGTDQILIGDQNDFAIAGLGSDSIDGDSDADGVRGRDIVAFNKSDGIDAVSRLGSGSTLSIGGGALYSGITLEADGNTLRVKTGSSHYVALNDWYGPTPNKSISTLQIVIEGSRDYKPTSTDPMNNRKIQAFDFLGLVAAFDAARATGQRFSVAGNLANYRLWSSDTDAIGGAIAYQYARSGSVSTLSYDQMRAVLTAPGFGVSAQSTGIASGTAMTEPTGSAALSEASAATVVTADALASQHGPLRVTADSAANGNDALNAGEQTIHMETADAGTEQATAFIDFPARNETASTALGMVPEQAAVHAPPRLQPSPVPALAVPLPGPSATVLAKAEAALAHSARPEDTPAAARHHPVGDEEEPAIGGASNSQKDTVQTARTRGFGQEDAVPREDEFIEWFAHDSLNHDLSLLDEILHGDVQGDDSMTGEAVAAAWRRSHAWLNRHLTQRGAESEAYAGGSAAASFFSDAGSFTDMPRRAVGLHDIAGHDLATFSGLREGASVLMPWRGVAL